MIFHFSKAFSASFHALNVIHYSSFRAMAALLTSLIFSFFLGGWFIEKSRKFFRSKARAWTPENHRAKDDMPTMGGIFILTVVFFNTFLWCNLANCYIWIILFCLFSFGLIGFLDDWKKVKFEKGISSTTKFLLQCAAAFITVFLLLKSGFNPSISFPFFKNLNPNVGLLFIPWAMFILVGCSNAVNLTDGLDGLAIGSLIPNFTLYSLICFLVGNFTIAHYLQLSFVNCSEITIIGATLVGVSIGFLWFNTYPAQIFMGDVGSLALGSGLALMALMTKQELLLPISGGLFVVEALSVILQVGSFRLYGRRVFKMAPIHHHFELLGWQESKITVRFGIISLILCLIALMTIKVR